MTHKAVKDLTSVEGEWNAKTDKLIKEIESLKVKKVSILNMLLKNKSRKRLQIDEKLLIALERRVLT